MSAMSRGFRLRFCDRSLGGLLLIRHTLVAVLFLALTPSHLWAAPLGPSAADACGAGLAAMSEYGVITLNDLSAGSEVGFKTYVGGDLISTNSTTFGARLQNMIPGSEDSVIIVGDMVSGSTLSVQAGSVRLGGTSNNRGINFNGGGSLIADPSLTNTAISADAIADSAALASLSANNTVSINGGNISFNVATVDANGVAVFDIADASSIFFQNANIQFSGSALSSATAIIINVAGTAVTYPSGVNINYNNTQSKVVWNYFEATTMQVNNVYNGSILAPLATVTAVSELKGPVVANNLSTGSVYGPLLTTDVAVAVCITLPVTLSYFHAQPSGNDVRFTWQTATETGNAGFNLLAESDEGIVQLNPELIQSTVIDALEPADYAVTLSTTATIFYVEEVGLDGQTGRLGPFALGTPYGSLIEPGDVTFVLYLPLMVQR